MSKKIIGYSISVKRTTVHHSTQTNEIKVIEYWAPTIQELMMLMLSQLTDVIDDNLNSNGIDYTDTESFTVANIDTIFNIPLTRPQRKNMPQSETYFRIMKESFKIETLENSA